LIRSKNRQCHLATIGQSKPLFSLREWCGPNEKHDYWTIVSGMHHSDKFRQLGGKGSGSLWKFPSRYEKEAIWAAIFFK
jgi:hypothetical protein